MGFRPWPVFRWLGNDCETRFNGVYSRNALQYASGDNDVIRYATGLAPLIRDKLINRINVSPSKQFLQFINNSCFGGRMSIVKEIDLSSPQAIQSVSTKGSIFF